MVSHSGKLVSHTSKSVISAITDSSSMVGSLDIAYEMILKALSSYVKKTYYPRIKFLPEGEVKRVICKKAVKQGSFTLPLGVDVHTFVDRFQNKIPAIFTQLRKSSETNVTKHVCEAYRRQEVPSTFPSSVEVKYEVETGTNLKTFAAITDDYRTSATDEGMLFFVENVLSRVNPKQHDFSLDRATQPLSEMFTVSDEAYALTMVLNQVENWRELSRPKDERRKEKLRKLFTAPRSGSRQSWSAEGQQIFHAVCRAVEEKRGNCITGYNFEHALKEHYKRTCPRYKAMQELAAKKQKKLESKSTILVTNFYTGDGMNDLLEDDDDDENSTTIEENSTTIEETQV